MCVCVCVCVCDHQIPRLSLTVHPYHTSQLAILLHIYHTFHQRTTQKAVFKVGSVAGPKPTRVRQGQKYLRPRRNFPYKAPGNKGVKAWGMALWSRRKSPVLKYTRQNRPEAEQPTEWDARTGEVKGRERLGCILCKHRAYVSNSLLVS